MPTLETIQLKRVFLFKDERLLDPDPFMTEEEVLETLSVIKPELACGFVKSKKLNEEDETEMLYEVGTNVGTKA